MLHNDLDVVNILKTMHKLKACVYTLMLDRQDTLQKAKQKYTDRTSVLIYNDQRDSELIPDKVIRFFSEDQFSQVDKYI